MFSVIILMSSLYLGIPSSYGYGSSFISAEAIEPGFYNLILNATDNDAYYKINCSQGQKLYLKISCNSSYDLDLYLYGPQYGPIASSITTFTTEAVTYTCSKKGIYYFRIYRYGGTGDVPFTLLVQREASGGFSSDSWWTFFVGGALVAMIAVALWIGLKNRVMWEEIQ